MKIYTDGSFNKKLSRNTTAYAAIIIVEENADEYILDVIYGINTDPNYTSMWNVGGEILGVISGVDYAVDHYNPKEITIYHDYIGLSKWVSGEWKAKNQATSSYSRYMKKIKSDRTVTFNKVLGHSNNQLNDLADYYANCGTKNYLETGKELNLITGLHVSKK